jgi:hypothetical protein
MQMVEQHLRASLLTQSKYAILSEQTCAHITGLPEFTVNLQEKDDILRTSAVNCGGFEKKVIVDDPYNSSRGETKSVELEMYGKGDQRSQHSTAFTFRLVCSHTHPPYSL